MNDKKEDLEEGELIPISSHPEYVLQPEPPKPDIEALRAAILDAIPHPEEISEKQPEPKKVETWRQWLKRRALEILRGDE